MARHRTHSIEFKRQVVQEFLGGELPQALAKRHGISRNLIKIWVAKYEAGGLDSDTACERAMNAPHLWASNFPQF